ncbi:hypothetical protein PENDEC_c022G02648 [Penicillium decumbens]|uniref:Uncharacterized protein n=1 Tax=Penicillium decumbens TaxID=69771 RepID=A0A1V6P0V8_PENDC|nr:hypothetical protein PENDEC_c022G02648 [Penicillium decumbens]
MIRMENDGEKMAGKRAHKRSRTDFEDDNDLTEDDSEYSRSDEDEEGC